MKDRYQERYKDRAYWIQLSERFYEAETTEQEEAELVRFLASPWSKGEEFDELRAVMGFLVVGKQVHTTRKTRRISGKFWRWSAAAAASLVLLVWGGYERSRQQNLCVAYVYGERFTDPEKVLLEMESSLKNLQYEEVENEIDNQLSSIFQTLSDRKE